MAGEYALRGARISEECDLVRILNGVKEGVMTENEVDEPTLFDFMPEVMP